MLCHTALGSEIYFLLSLIFLGSFRLPASSRSHLSESFILEVLMGSRSWLNAGRCLRYFRYLPILVEKLKAPFAMHDPTRLCIMNMYFHGSVDFGRSILFHCKSILSSPQEGWHRYPECVLEEPSEPCSLSVWTCSDTEISPTPTSDRGWCLCCAGRTQSISPSRKTSCQTHAPSQSRKGSKLHYTKECKRLIKTGTRSQQKPIRGKQLRALRVPVTDICAVLQTLGWQ